MDGESSPLMNYLFSYSKKEQRREKKHLPVEENKEGSPTGPPNYASGLMTRRNTYGGNTNLAELCNHLDQA